MAILLERGSAKYGGEEVIAEGIARIANGENVRLQFTVRNVDGTCKELGLYGETQENGDRCIQVQWRSKKVVCTDVEL